MQVHVVPVGGKDIQDEGGEAPLGVMARVVRVARAVPEEGRILAEGVPHAGEAKTLEMEGVQVEAQSDLVAVSILLRREGRHGKCEMRKKLTN